MAPRPKSLDGMVPATPRRRSLYIDRHEAAPVRRVSLQPRHGAQVMDVVGSAPTRRSKRPLTAKPQPHTPLLKPVRLPAAPKPGYALTDTDVVLRLSKTHSLRARTTSLLQYLALAGIALASAYSTGVGQWFVLAYALYALVFRRSSAGSFAIALFILVSVPIFQLLGQTGVANNMAVYVYELLVLGTLQAIIELRWPRRSDID